MTTGSSSGARLGCTWILSISRFASSQASKFCGVGSKSARDVWSYGERTFLHHSWWILDMAMHISRISATFCLWNRSKSAWIVDDAYFKSCAETCSASSNYPPSQLPQVLPDEIERQKERTWEIDSLVLLSWFRLAVSGSTSIRPCRE